MALSRKCKAFPIRHPELDSGSMIPYHHDMTKKGYTYILASGNKGTLYIGVTSDLIKRVYQHKEGLAESFTKEYDVKMLVHFEEFEGIEDAIAREKQLKQWRRDWKVALIEENNPNWMDLYSDINGP